MHNAFCQLRCIELPTDEALKFSGPPGLITSMFTVLISTN